MATKRSSDAHHAKMENSRGAQSGLEHDQDSEPPRTAIPPGGSTEPVEAPASVDPNHDQDRDPPRTAVPPK